MRQILQKHFIKFIPKELKGFIIFFGIYLNEKKRRRKKINTNKKERKIKYIYNTIQYSYEEYPNNQL